MEILSACKTAEEKLSYIAISQKITTAKLHELLERKVEGEMLINCKAESEAQLKEETRLNALITENLAKVKLR